MPSTITCIFAFCCRAGLPGSRFLSMSLSGLLRRSQGMLLTHGKAVDPRSIHQRMARVLVRENNAQTCKPNHPAVSEATQFSVTRKIQAYENTPIRVSPTE